MKKFNLIVMGIIILLTINIISAWEFDNVKTYDSEKREVTFKNSILGVPTTDIAKVKLETDLVYSVMPGENRKVAEFTINLYSDEYIDPIKDIELYTKYGMKINREIKYKYKTYEDYYIDVPSEYKEVCSEVYKNCSQVISAYKKELRQKEIWKDLDIKNLKKGSVTIGLFTTVKPGDFVEWIPTMFGDIKVNEWAVWNASFSDKLIAYWNFDTDGRDNTLNGNNCSGNAVHSNTGGILGGYYSFSQHYLYCKNNGALAPERNFTLSFWINDSTTASFQEIIAQFRDTGNSNIEFHIGDWGSTYKLGFEAYPASGTIDGSNAPFNITTAGQWGHVVFRYNGTAFSLWLNGAFYKQVPGSGNLAYTGLANLSIGGRMEGGSGWNYTGAIDEMGYWNRSLSSSEILDLYNGGLGLEYSEYPNLLAVTLNNPADNYNTANNLITFNCSATDETGVLNLTLKINGTANTTITGGVGQNLSLEVSKTLGEGNYTWSCEANDGVDIKITDNRSLYIDTIAPVINIISPLNNSLINTFSQSNAVSFNISINEAGILGSCIYFNSTNNNTIVCKNNATITLVNGGYFTFIYYANDSVGNFAYNQTRFFINYIRPLINYSEYSVSGEITQINFNISADNITQANATIYYNNTLYDMDLISGNGTTIVFSKSITSPLVNINTIIPFNITYYVNNIKYNTSTYNQTVYNVPPLNISAGRCAGFPIYWFTLQDEENLTTLSGNFEYNFYYGKSNASLVRTYGKITGSTNFSICVNSTVSNNWTIGSGEIFYDSEGYVDRRYYIFDNTIVSSNSNLTLYDLVSTEQTSFKLEIEDTSLNAYKGVYATLLRWYPDLNEYKTVDIGKTDDTGNTVIHVKTEDVDYRIGVYYSNGSLIKLADPMRMVCLASPCTYTLKISPGDIDYTSFLNVQYNFDYNYTTGIWTFTFSDSTLKTDTINLTVYKLTSTNDLIVCSNSVTGSSGAVSCNTSLYTGTLKAEVTREASPGVVIVQKIIKTGSNAFKSPFGLWLSLLIGIPIIFIFAVVSPIAAIIGGVVALLPAFYFGSINLGVVGGIAILGGIVAHFLKRIG